MQLKGTKITVAVLGVIVILVLLGFFFWPNILTLMLPADSRPAAIHYPDKPVTSEEFDKVAAELNQEYNGDFPHIKRFREAGILSYEGPQTCLKCHQQMTVKDVRSGEEKKVDLMENLTSSAHYTFFTKSHTNVYGFDGKVADNFPMGKIDRPCPKPGSFAFSAWASYVVTERGDTLSEGCGQCHMGGQYQAPVGEILPGYKTRQDEKDAIDCLICHSVGYDMNQKTVVKDNNNRYRWAMDRSLKAALSVGKTTAQTCLRCHQHNMGGDIYIDEADPSYMESQVNHGLAKSRVLHPGSKRGTPYSPSWDVHAAVGLACTECHITEGHLIARGTHTTTLMTNDLPDVEVSCETCHTKEPHSDSPEMDEYLNMHTEKIACQTCHIPSLHPDNATMRDFNHPMFEEEAGIYIYDDILKETAPNKGIMYVWWNGDATFLGNPIGDNPNGANLYQFYKPTHVWPEFKDFDYNAWYERVMRPIAKKGRPSKIYAMKRFNGKQHIDLQNMGPFGGMFIPYDLPVYYVSGNADLAARKEMEKSMMKMMYGTMFKVYLMDDFMKYMDDGSGKYITGWNTEPYQDLVKGTPGKMEARWIPMDASLEISHAIRREGAFTCNDCHSENGILDFKSLGYTPDEIESLQEKREL